jgi:thymidylate synthase ThyX
MSLSPPSLENAAHVRRIYTLSDLPPEVIAVAFAKTSRVPHTFEQIAAELTEEKSSQFHEKWVVGYGHASVAEHAVLHIALENVSILATKVIEDNRLASYTEQSTRYQVYADDRFFRPPSLLASTHAERFVATGRALMGAYTEWVERMIAHLEPRTQRREGTSDRLWKNKIRAAACDVLRYLLPTATQTNLGWTANARVMEHAITKLRSHPLEEMRAIGDEIHAVCTARVPTLLKYADAKPFLRDTPPALAALADEQLSAAPLDDQWDVRLAHFDADAEERVVATLLYEHASTSYEETRRRIRAMDSVERARVLDAAVAHRGKWDQVSRAFEATSYTFDVLIDYGAYRDLQRHRMCTQIGQPVTTAHGFVTPPEIREAQLAPAYEALMAQARETFETIAEDFPLEAQYIVPLACRKRTLFTMNLRELHHLVQLRSAPQGHISYRRMANRMLEQVRRVHPTLAAQVRCTSVD